VSMSAMATSPPTITRLAKFDRLMIGLGFLATTCVTSYLTFVSQDRAAECQSIRAQRIIDVDRFRTIAVQFDPLVRTYMGDALKGRTTSTSKAAVVNNLNEQRSRLAYVEPYLSTDGKEKAKRLSTAIENFIAESDKNPTGVNVGPMYQELSYIFDNSKDLIAASNRATGMDNINVSTGRFWRKTLNCSDS
jgi:hypothetical protein